MAFDGEISWFKVGDFELLRDAVAVANGHRVGDDAAEFRFVVDIVGAFERSDNGWSERGVNGLVVFEELVEKNVMLADFGDFAWPVVVHEGVFFSFVDDKLKQDCAFGHVEDFCFEGVVGEDDVVLDGVFAVGLFERRYFHALKFGHGDEPIGVLDGGKVEEEFVFAGLDGCFAAVADVHAGYGVIEAGKFAALAEDERVWSGGVAAEAVLLGEGFVVCIYDRAVFEAHGEVDGDEVAWLRARCWRFSSGFVGNGRLGSWRSSEKKDDGNGCYQSEE